jgi:hypothetical protein
MDEWTRRTTPPIATRYAVEASDLLTGVKTMHRQRFVDFHVSYPEHCCALL